MTQQPLAAPKLLPAPLVAQPSASSSRAIAVTCSHGAADTTSLVVVRSGTGPAIATSVSTSSGVLKGTSNQQEPSSRRKSQHIKRTDWAGGDPPPVLLHPEPPGASIRQSKQRGSPSGAEASGCYAAPTEPTSAARLFLGESLPDQCPLAERIHTEPRLPDRLLAKRLAERRHPKRLMVRVSTSSAATGRVAAGRVAAC